MADKEWLLVVFFDSAFSERVPPIEKIDDEEQPTSWLGLPLWIPSSTKRSWEEDWAKHGVAPSLARHKGAVFLWAVDYAATTDDRWVVFGTFESRKAAENAYFDLIGAGNDVVGYRVLTEWGFSGKFKLKSWMYTDG